MLQKTGVNMKREPTGWKNILHIAQHISDRDLYPKYIKNAMQ